MGEMFSGMVECLDLMYSGLTHNDIKVIEKAECALEGSSDRAVSLTEAMVQECKSSPETAAYVSVPSHIDRIRVDIGRIVSSLRMKINEEILFSDRAISELEYMFERTRDIVVHSRDMVITRNPLAAKHLKGADKAVEKIANEYSTKHEERLIEGLCAPKASSIFINMLEAFKNIAWHASQIAKDLDT
jgi:Na+/phosphate symporter